jgi:hypothetical protein
MHCFGSVNGILSSGALGFIFCIVGCVEIYTEACSARALRYLFLSAKESKAAANRAPSAACEQVANIPCRKATHSQKI